MTADYSAAGPAIGLTTGAVLPDALTDLSLRQLLSFRAVADEGSFHGAADALDYTQSAVSQHVMGLEAALGVRLFDRGRGRRTVELTEAGRLLQRHVEAITDRLQAARADLLAYAAGETGTLRVGVYQSVGTRVLPAIIGRFGEAWPNVEIRLTEANSDQGLFELLGPGALDLSFGVLPLQEGPFEAVELLHDPFVLVTAAGSPLAGPGPAVHRAHRRAAADRLPVVPQHPLGRGPHARARRRTELRVPVRGQRHGPGDGGGGAGHGHGAAAGRRHDRPRGPIIPTDLPARRIALIWHRDRYRSPAALAFVEIACQVAAGIQADLATYGTSVPRPDRRPRQPAWCPHAPRASRRPCRARIGRNPLVYSAGARQPVSKRSDHAPNYP